MTTKPISIPKSIIWDAYKRVKANRGAAGIDNQSISDFEEDLKNNLYKIWNRMSSGSYFPPPVKQVPIAKKGGNGVRKLSVPSVSDRIAQTVVKFYLEPCLEPIFHTDSYGYRPRRSALDAVAVTRRRCWRYAWLVEFDIRKAFDSLDREMLFKAIRHHVTEKWIVMYIERWLTAPIITPEGEEVIPCQGVPQGSVIGPVLMNLFMHYTFDYWMERMHPDCPFARYADDAVVHCKSKQQAEQLLNSITQRLQDCRLEIHPDKSKIVYCKSNMRPGTYKHVQFTFLGFDFRPRWARQKGKKRAFIGFIPAISDSAQKDIRAQIRAFHLHRRNDLSLLQIAQYWNPIVRGWWNYYGKFNPSEFRRVTNYLHMKIIQWARRKYVKLRHSKKASRDWLRRVIKKMPTLLYSATLFESRLVG